jgi:hypothetical protein
MARKRVHEIAKQQGLTSRELLAKLQAAGVEAKTASSSVEEADARKALGNGRAPAKEAKQAAPTKDADADAAAPPPKPAAPKQRPTRDSLAGERAPGAGAGGRRRVVIDSQASRRQAGGPPAQPPRRQRRGRRRGIVAHVHGLGEQLAVADRADDDAVEVRCQAQLRRRRGEDLLRRRQPAQPRRRGAHRGRCLTVPPDRLQLPLVRGLLVVRARVAGRPQSRYERGDQAVEIIGFRREPEQVARRGELIRHCGDSARRRRRGWSPAACAGCS